jgi:hypothetical protein
MSFTGLKHSLIEAILSIHMGLSPIKKKVYLHSMTDLLKSYRMGFGKTRSAHFFFTFLEKYRSIPSILKN